jgi:hypothetical protein
MGNAMKGVAVAASVGVTVADSVAVGGIGVEVFVETGVADGASDAGGTCVEAAHAARDTVRKSETARCFNRII